MISDSYASYLDRFDRTITVSELHHSPNSRNLVALRHDIDYDFDIALEMAHLEHRRGLRASYYLLPTAAYWADPAFALKVRQLASYGHEVGLHVNSMARWLGGEI